MKWAARRLTSLRPALQSGQREKIMTSSLPCPFTLRSMRPDDLPAILEIQRACYVPAMNEDGETLRARLASAPDFSWVGERAGKVFAYLACYPSMLDKITRLGGNFHVPAKPDCLYFHDLAVQPGSAGGGYGAALVTHALQAGWQRGLRQATLVCVQDALGFWQRQGFSEREAVPEAARTALATYPGKARYMARLIG
jgi:N-acetylglutamate synthase-like GNAT family acetyltransferase